MHIANKAIAAVAHIRASNYVAVCEGFTSRVDFFGKSPVGSPAGSPFESEKLVTVVDSTIPGMPSDFQGIYGKVLQAALPTVCANLKLEMEQSLKDGEKKEEALADATATIDTLVGAVRDWSVREYRAPLRRFEAVISNLYRSFLDKERRRHLGLPLTEVLPPLATFAATGDWGPFTIPIDTIRSLAGASVAVVSLPGTYREHPLLWAALAHETGGHDVSHANVGLLDELSDGVKSLDGLSREVASLWSFWIDEIVSDIYGLLNLGPSFVLSITTLLACLRKAAQHNWPNGVVDTSLAVTNHAPADEHPVDILRIYAAEGALSALSDLSKPSLKRWQDLITGVAQQATGGKTTIDIVDSITGKTVRTLKLNSMAQAARKVGAYIVTAKLNTLNGRTIQEIETWDDADEQAALGVFRALAEGRPILALGDDAQLLAGATMAYFDNPTRYEDITAALNDALDDSFRRDPVFGSYSSHVTFRRTRGKRRGRAHHRTYRSLEALTTDSPRRTRRETAD